MRWEELDREPCSLARSLSIVGDRWTLLVLRECFLRVRRFEEFEQRLGIAQRTKRQWHVPRRADCTGGTNGRRVAGAA